MKLFDQTFGVNAVTFSAFLKFSGTGKDALPKILRSISDDAVVLSGPSDDRVVFLKSYFVEFDETKIGDSSWRLLGCQSLNISETFLTMKSIFRQTEYLNEYYSNICAQDSYALRIELKNKYWK